MVVEKIYVSGDSRIGYLYENEGYKCLVSKEKALEKELEDADILDYISAETEECLVKGSNVYLVSDALYKMNEECEWIRLYDDVNVGFYEKQKDEIEVWGYIFKTNQCTELDNEYALNRMITGIEL